MIRYTTPAIPLTVDTVIPEGAQVYVTFSQGETALTKSEVDITRGETDTEIVVTLSQAETGLFKALAPILVQCNWLTNDGTRVATSSAMISSIDNLLDEVVEYGD